MSQETHRSFQPTHKYRPTIPLIRMHSSNARWEHIKFNRTRTTRHGQTFDGSTAEQAIDNIHDRFGQSVPHTIIYTNNQRIYPTYTQAPTPSPNKHITAIPPLFHSRRSRRSSCSPLDIAQLTPPIYPYNTRAALAQKCSLPATPATNAH